MDVKPWDKKLDPNRRGAILRTLIDSVYCLAHYMSPYVPEASAYAFKQLNLKPMALCDLSQDICNVPPGHQLGESGILFERYGSRYTRTGHTGAKKGKAGGGKTKSGQPARKPGQKKINRGNLPLPTRLNFVIGKVLSAEAVPGSDKLFKEMIDIGEDQPRQILSGLQKFVKKEDLEGTMVVVFANLKPAKMAGLASNGMVLCSNEDDEDGNAKAVELLCPPSGAKVGERLTIDGVSYDDIPYDNACKPKKNPWKKFLPDFRTNDKGEMCWKGTTFKCSTGTIICKTLKNCQVR